MEIKLNFRLQTIFNLIHFVENMELETAALVIVALLLTPFVMGSLWSLVIAVVCQLFWLGVKAGVVLFIVCAATLPFLRMTKIVAPSGGPQVNKCTLMDAVLTVLFQAGFRIPQVIWDRVLPPVSTGGTNGGAYNGIRHEMVSPGPLKRDVVTEQPLNRRTVKDRGSEAEDGTDENTEVIDDSELGGAGDFSRPRRSCKSSRKVIRDVTPSSTSAVPSTQSAAAVIGGPADGTRRRRTRTRGRAGGKNSS